MKNTFAIVVLLLLLSALLPNHSAFALSCEEPKEPAKDRYDMIVVGEIVSAKPHFPQTHIMSVRMNVQRSWNQSSEEWIKFDADATWGVSYEKGKTYVVYLNDEKGKYKDPLCSPSGEWNDDDKNVTASFGKEMEVTKKTGLFTTPELIFGSVFPILLFVGIRRWLKWKKLSRSDQEKDEE